MRWHKTEHDESVFVRVGISPTAQRSKENEGPGSDARPHSSALVAFGIASACVCFESLRFALTGTSPDPEKAAEDGAKTIGGRLASLFVGAFCGFAVLCAAQMVFLGRIVWLPFF